MDPVLLTLLTTALAEIQQILMDHIAGSADTGTSLTRLLESLGRLDDAVALVAKSAEG